ncbi:hypothetical protein DAPPUDRAFT_238478 [Daphnia pulex]|uniref:Uncharacterized protein n=1 Tax=Daphnia pulex TaxID=6669 RepID=E9G6I5_DAPPU|nr:hypothetical protein DAPPUDRAFT_238478 [Daphnia pulex]|eukprot:EFX84942.1 hypothetical protein DAPPUDRAFT_238478 [Daphnia pulex]
MESGSSSQPRRGSSFQDDTEPLAVEGKETGTRWVASVAEFSISGVFEWDLDLLFPNLERGKIKDETAARAGSGGGIICFVHRSVWI